MIEPGERRCMKMVPSSDSHAYPMLLISLHRMSVFSAETAGEAKGRVISPDRAKYRAMLAAISVAARRYFRNRKVSHPSCEQACRNRRVARASSRGLAARRRPANQIDVLVRIDPAQVIDGQAVIRRTIIGRAAVGP